MPAPEPAATPRKRGPKTPEGKARAALDATRHGLRARHFALLPHEDPAELEALARAARETYRPACPIERELVEAIVVALWREIRADRLEGEVLADIPPVDGARSCGSDLLEERHHRALALLLRYRAQAAAAVRRAQDALARHRRLVAEAAGRLPACDPLDAGEAVAPAARAPAGPAGRADPTNCTNEFPSPTGAAEAGSAAADSERADPTVASVPVVDPIPEPKRPPPRLELRDSVRKARNPLDTPYLRALGRDPDLVLPVPGLPPETWPIVQHLADPEGRPIDGQGPYRRVPHLDWGDWLAHQHALPIMERVAAAGGTPRAAEPSGDRAAVRHAA